MNMLLRCFFLLIVLAAASAAQAQTEQVARTWIGGGVSVTQATAAEDGRKIFAGFYLDAAYDLRHGFQGRFYGERREQAAILQLFTGKGSTFEATSELRYGGALLYHVAGEGYVRLLIGGGLVATRHFFKETERPFILHRYGDGFVYNSSVNPFYLIGAGLGKNKEITFAQYLRDTYGNSQLRGYGVDFSHTKRLVDRLHLRGGVRARYWLYREPGSPGDKKDGEVVFFVGFHVQ